MKIVFKYISVALLSGTLGLFTSCGNDYLNLEPQSTVTPELYLSTDAQLRAYLMPLYESIENHSTYSSMGLYGGKETTASQYGSDDMINQLAHPRFVDGQWQVNTSSTSFWNFTSIYKVNYFLENAEAKLAAGQISGSSDLIKHCIGEGYWFRAYFHYLKWKDVGDFPIITKVLPDQENVLLEACERSPRNEVARFILSDLDKAAEYMMDTDPKGAGYLLDKNCAYILKSRVALFEATWLENFKGTAFVPGGAGWPGASKDYNSDFKYESGSIEEEIKFFLNEALTSSDKIASTVPLTANNGVTPQSEADSNPYYEMFSSEDMSGYPEVLFWRDYDPAIKLWKCSHAINYNLSKSGAGNGMTRGLVMQFLDRKGLPWYASEDFTNDDDIFVARLGKGGEESMDSSESLRDLRISLFLKNPGQTNIWINRNMAIKGMKDEAVAPMLAHGNVDRSVTGYQLRKGLNPDGANCSGNGKSANGCPIFRAAEAYLTYIEAYYMLNGNLGGNATTYWEALRTRAGIEAGTIQNTIDAIDITKEAKFDWAAYTAGQLLIDKTLFAIRKERRSEYMAESLRADDLRRWRAMDQMTTTPYHIQGIGLWNEGNWALYPETGGSMSSNVTSRDMLVEYPSSGAVISAKGDLTDVNPEDGNYIYPYRVKSSLNGYNGYSWKMAHYLCPLEIKDMTLTSNGGDLSTSPIYQNPYWPTEAGGTAQQ